METKFNVASFFVLTVLVTLAESRGLTCRDAANMCDFAFKNKGKVPSFSLTGPADVPFTKRIVSKNRDETLGHVNMTILGVLNTNNIAVDVIEKRLVFPITALSSNPPLTPTHLKPYSIRYTSGSGVGHQVLSKSQRRALNGRCIRIFFTEYQLLNKDGSVRTNINGVPRSEENCVVFRVHNDY